MLNHESVYTQVVRVDTRNPCQSVRVDSGRLRCHYEKVESKFNVVWKRIPHEKAFQGENRLVAEPQLRMSILHPCRSSKRDVSERVGHDWQGLARIRVSNLVVRPERGKS